MSTFRIGVKKTPQSPAKGNTNQRHKLLLRLTDLESRLNELDPQPLLAPSQDSPSPSDRTTSSDSLDAHLIINDASAEKAKTEAQEDRERVAVLTEALHAEKLKFEQLQAKYSEDLHQYVRRIRELEDANTTQKALTTQLELQLKASYQREKELSDRLDSPHAQTGQIPSPTKSFQHKSDYSSGSAHESPSTTPKADRRKSADAVSMSDTEGTGAPTNRTGISSFIFGWRKKDKKKKDTSLDTYADHSNSNSDISEESLGRRRFRSNTATNLDVPNSAKTPVSSPSKKKKKADGPNLTDIEMDSGTDKSPKKMKPISSKMKNRHSERPPSRTPSNANHRPVVVNGESNMAFGVRRGSCNSCNCPGYVKSHEGFVCKICGHYPGYHLDITDGPHDDKAERVIPSASIRVSSSKARDELVKETFNHTAAWVVDYNDLFFESQLGKGQSATVFEGTLRGEKVALKVLRLEGQKQIEDFKQELEIMDQVQNPRLVHFFGATLTPKLCLVIEFCPNGSLFHYLQGDNQMTWDKVLLWMRQTAEGLCALHSYSPPIVHRDLKSLNLLLDANYDLKMCDFGLSRFVAPASDAPPATLMKMRGTYAYIAPEVYHSKPFSSKSDVHSFAVVSWEMLHRLLSGKFARPYAEFTHIVHDFQIIVQVAKGLRPTIPPSCPELVANLLAKCWAQEPNDRPAATELLKLLDEVNEAYQANKAEWDAVVINDRLTSSTPGSELAKPMSDVSTSSTLTTSGFVLTTSGSVLTTSGHSPVDDSLGPKPE